MRVLAWLLAIVNVWFGARALLNALGILQTSKYARTTDVVFAMLFLGLGAAGAWLLLARGASRTALLVGVGPWVLGFLMLLVTMLTSNYQ